APLRVDLEVVRAPGAGRRPGEGVGRAVCLYDRAVDQEPELWGRALRAARARGQGDRCARACRADRARAQGCRPAADEGELVDRVARTDEDLAPGFGGSGEVCDR